MGQERYGDPAIDAIEVCARARRGEATALGIVQEAAGWMGLAVGNLLQTLNLERVILGTIAIEAGDLFLDAIIQSAQRHCWAEVWEGASIVAAGLGAGSQDLAALAVASLAQ
jgi:predicted NBD/HSP70 family sugar kinase